MSKLYLLKLILQNFILLLVKLFFNSNQLNRSIEALNV